MKLGVGGQAWRWWLVLAGLALGVMGQAAPPAAAQSTSQGTVPEVLGITVSSLAVNPGEPVVVEARVLNPLKGEVEYAVALLVDDVPQEERRVRLPGGASRTLRFTVVRSQPGAHVVRLGPEAATFQVLGARFVVRDLVVTPDVVAPGEPVVLRATVENVGPAQGLFQVPLKVEGELTEARGGLLAAGQATTIAFELRAQVPGGHSFQIGELSGAYQVAAPLFEFSVPSQLRVSVVTSSARSATGGPLAVTGDAVVLDSLGEGAVTLPVALPPQGQIASFLDPVSGVTFNGQTLVLPLRDAEYREVARLVIQALAVTGLGDSARVTVKGIQLVVPSAPLPVSGLQPPLESMTFGVGLALPKLEPGMVFRLTPGRRPPPEALARLEVGLRSQGRTLAEVAAVAVLEMPPFPGGPRATATVTFGVPSAWLAGVDIQAVAVAQFGREGEVRFYPVRRSASQGGLSLLEADVVAETGRLALLVSARSAAIVFDQLLVSVPVGLAGVPVEVRATASRGSSGGAFAMLRVNGAPVAVERVVRASDGSVGATFFWLPGGPGTYSMDVEGKGAQVVIGLPDILGHVQVLQLNVSPLEVAPGQAVDVMGMLANVGPRSAVSEVVLYVNDVPVESRWLDIGSGELGQVRFRWVPAWPGAYTMRLLNVRANVKVTVASTPASFEVTELKVEPDVVSPGASSEVTFLVQNTGEQAGTYTARVFLNQQEVWHGELVVEGLTAVPVSVPVRPSGRGIFNVVVAGLQHDIVVVSTEERSALVLEALTVRPPTVAGGEPVTLIVTLRNRSAEAARGVMTVLVNGEREGEREVVLKGQETREEVVELVREAPGLYQVEVRQGAIAQVVSSVKEGQFLVTRRRTPPLLQVSRVEVLPQPAAPLQPAQINVLLANLGEQDGVFPLTLKVNGQTAVESEVQLAAQTSRVLTLSLAGRTAGTYDVEVNGVHVAWVVREEPRPTPEATPTVVEGGPEQGSGRIIAMLVLAIALAALAGVAYAVVSRRRRPGR